MAKTKGQPRIHPKGTLQRFLADAAARVAAGEVVDPLDIRGGRTIPRAAPDPIVTPEGSS